MEIDQHKLGRVAPRAQPLAQVEGRPQHLPYRQVQPLHVVTFSAQQIYQTDDAHRYERIRRTGTELVEAGFNFLFGRVNVENVHAIRSMPQTGHFRKR